MQEFPNQHPALFAVAICAGFITWFAFITWVTALVAGWRSLAGRYRTDREFPEHRRRMQSAMMRSGIGMNHALTFGSDEEGIYMGLTIPILAGYPKLFIPWSDIQVEEPRRWWFLMRRRLRLGPDAIPLRIREPLAQFLLQARGGENVPVAGTISSTF